MSGRVYLDHAATTPVLPEAQAAMAEACARFANPSSPHAEGRAAKAALEEARARIAAALGWDGAVIFTSGASEAAALAFGRVKVDRQWISAVEHDAIRRAAPDARVIPVDAAGQVDPDGFEGRSLVAIQSVNSETGVIQDMDALPAIMNMRQSVWLADCSQSAGKLPLPERADLVIVSAHKLGGPPGVGALLVGNLALLEPTGGQEQGYRGGTENLPAILGFAAALEARGSRAHLVGLRARLEAGIRANGGEVVAEASPRLAEIGAYRLPGMAAVAQLIQLDLAGFAVSAGSACASGTLKASPVLTAMGWPAEAAGEVIRVSFGLATNAEEVERFLAAWTAMAERARARAA